MNDRPYVDPRRISSRIVTFTMATSNQAYEVIGYNSRRLSLVIWSDNNIYYLFGDTPKSTAPRAGLPYFDGSTPQYWDYREYGSYMQNAVLCVGSGAQILVAMQETTILGDWPWPEDRSTTLIGQTSIKLSRP